MNPASAPPTSPSGPCPFGGFRSGRYRPSPPEIAAGQHVTVITDVSSADNWLRYFLTYDPLNGFWGLDEPGYGGMYLITGKANPALVDRDDVEAAQRWATACITDEDDSIWLDDAPDGDSPARTDSRVTQWQPVILAGRVGYVPLFTDTMACQTPFTTFAPGTGSCCVCRTDCAE